MYRETDQACPARMRIRELSQVVAERGESLEGARAREKRRMNIRKPPARGKLEERGAATLNSHCDKRRG